MAKDKVRIQMRLISHFDMGWWDGGQKNKMRGLVIFKMWPTTQRIPRRSPIQVLTLPNVA